MRFAKPLVLAIALGAMIVAGGANASASCVQPRPLPQGLDESQIVFVGTVVYTWDGDRQARVRVESIWRGPVLPAYVEVHGSPAEGASTATSVDRTYKAGGRYLFALSGTSPPFADNICTATQIYTPALDAYAPAHPQQPMSPTAIDPVANVAGPYWPIGLVVILLLAAAAVLIIVRRRSRPQP
jgi:hypothetical protein